MKNETTKTVKKFDDLMVKVLNSCCNYKHFRDGVKYYFENEITVNNDNIHIVIWCEKLTHQIDIYITNASNELEHKYDIKFYHNDDVLLYTMTDMRIEFITQCIEYEIDIIIEMNS